MALEQNVNCYVSLDEAETYFETRIDSGAWLNADDEDKESALVTATLILDENQFIGVAVSSEQSLGWPRNGASFVDPKLGLVVAYGNTEIPSRLKKAVYEQAYHLLSNENLLDNKSQNFEEISIGSITLKDTNKDTTRASMTSNLARKFIKPLLTNQGSNSWWRVN
jgi:hypothetical protein